MSRLVSQILIALACVCAVPILYLTTFIVLERRWLRGDADALLAATIITGAAFITAWIVIWRNTVRWTGVRRVLTALSVLWSAGAASVIVLIVDAIMARGDRALAIVLGGAIWMPLWMLSTAKIWRETGTERAMRINPRAGGHLACPACGYDLRGLSEARCPECGRRYTLEQIVSLAMGVDELADILDAPAETPHAREPMFTFTAPDETR